MASFLYCFSYSFRSPNYCDSNSCRSFTLLKALAKSKVIFSLSPLRARKSDNYRYRDSWKSDSFRERTIKKRSKELILKRMQRGLRVITLQGTIEKSPILLSKYWKFEYLDGNIIILYLGVSNSIFADCIYLNFSSIVIAFLNLPWVQ